MEAKKHYKLYKSGKLWCVAAITVVLLTMTGVDAHADSNQNGAPLTTPQVGQPTALKQGRQNAAVQATTAQPAQQVIDYDTINTAVNDQGQVQAYT